MDDNIAAGYIRTDARLRPLISPVQQGRTCNPEDDALTIDGLRWDVGVRAMVVARMTDEENLVRALQAATCCVCAATGGFAALGAVADPDQPNRLHPDRREDLVCAGCGSTSRDRGLVATLGVVLREHGPLSSWGPRSSMRILETAGSRAHPGLLAERYDYYNTQYAEPSAAGSVDGRVTADVQSLHYPDGHFDVVLSSDVFEHVREHRAGLQEIHRVLTAKGTLVLTVPYAHAWEHNRVLVHPHGDRDIYLEPPQYHAADTLVYRIYGRELLSELREAGFTVGHLALSRTEAAVSPQDIFVATRAPYFELHDYANAGIAEA